ncbi:Outer membrane protein [Minicystis rosea]|nr:Outer membrane protein [Minicystis rosea]
MLRMRLTSTARALLAALVVGATSIALYTNPKLLGKVAPEATAQRPKSNVPPVAELPGERADGALPVVADAAPGCAQLPEVRFYHWAWNAQMGLMLANGGKQAVAGSSMCKHGVNLKLTREDNADQMQAEMASFAESLKRGEAEPAKGAHFVAIMGDGSAQFLKGLNDKLAALGPEYTAAVVGSAGYSRGEDKLMGPPAWRDDPQASRGGLVAGVLRDGDWNIALKWLGDNKVPNNPDETAYDPDALNWVGASDYVDAAQKYVNGHCAELRNVKTGKKEKHCVDAVVTWTPGDVAVAEQKGGLVSIVSTKEYRSQMPNVIIGNRKWMSAHREMVKGMLGAIFEAGEQIKQDDGALRRAAAVSAVVYKEKDAGYWYKYFTSQKVQDKKGITVDLGGSSVNNLADNAQLFGLAPGSVNAFAATYTVFGNVVHSQYPALLPAFAPAEQVVDVSYLKELLATSAPSAPDVTRFASEQKVKQVIGRRAWDIRFTPGSAVFSPDARKELSALRDELVVAGGTLVEIHGHTDSDGGAEANMRLSEQRAFAAKRWLEQEAPSAFPEGRIRVFAHGQTEPVESNATLDGRAKNRRVVVVIGTPGA